MRNNEGPDIIEEHLNECSKLLSNVLQANDNVLLLLPDEEKDVNVTYWSQPKCEHFNSLMTEIENWTIMKWHHCSDDEDPDDSTSIAPYTCSKKAWQVEGAALLELAATLKKIWILRNTK